MTELKTFESLECYRLARELRKQIAGFCKDLPVEEKFLLRDQIVRSSRSVTANIAEGYGRHHHQENIQYCRQARGSLTESLDHLNVALDDAYMNQQMYSELRQNLEHVWKVLNGYIAYLVRCSKQGVPHDSE